jgi:precorrin-6A/cobalt-precorrin-6A reductase
MNLLLLGGTAEAKQLARDLQQPRGLQQQGVEVIYSLAGLVRQPQLDCRVVSGGFSVRGGLHRFIEDEAVDAILDVTHPYAQYMSERAVEVARQCGIPVWRYQRPSWQPQPGDTWQEFADWPELLTHLRPYRSVFLSAGQLSQDFVESVRLQSGDSGQRHLLRTATALDFDLPASMTWVEGIGPFDIDSERALFERHAVDVVVTKNSGGSATIAKLTLAREQGLPVFLLQRPQLAAADVEFERLDECLSFVVAQSGVTA